ncbi:methyltransferase domain-containing protein [Nonomuraea basaltis]|uniref:methyltransferase domain-containing protein n=1 Tax=Nonomuraea basaltis TaxID=2495887 RepID=UPI00197FCE60|nr:methyltransferase domain-containing protein [Nonomuraea basaltis]
MPVTEWRLFESDSPAVATFAFHEHRPRAAHLEQSDHHARLHTTAQLIRDLAPASVVDLGCGDGGLLSLIKDIPSWGYDFHPASAQGWAERGVTAEHRDVFGARDVPKWGQVAVMTEVLEHLADPHGTVEWVSRHAEWVVASSPKDETGDRHGDCHAWAWDIDGYRALFEPHYQVTSHTTVDWSQIIVGRSRRT